MVEFSLSEISFSLLNSLPIQLDIKNITAQQRDDTFFFFTKNNKYECSRKIMNFLNPKKYNKIKSVTINLSEDFENAFKKIIPFFCGKKVFLTKDNVQLCYDIGEQLEIEILCETSKSYKEVLEKYEDIQSFLTFQEKIENLSETNFEEIVETLINYENKEFMINFIMYIISIRVTKIMLFKELLIRISSERAYRSGISSFFINMNHSKSIQVYNRFIFYQMVKNNVIPIEKALKKIIASNDLTLMFWFCKELNEYDFKMIIKIKKACYGKYQFSDFLKWELKYDIDYFDNLKENNWFLYEKFSENFYENPIIYAICHDDVDFLSTSTMISSSDYNDKIKPGIFDPKIFLKKGNMSSLCEYNHYNMGEYTYTNYAAYYGSIKCFKYLLLNGAIFDQIDLICAICGGNFEIIHILEQRSKDFNLVFTDDELITYCNIFHRREIKSWLFNFRNVHGNENIQTSIFFYNFFDFISMFDIYKTKQHIDYLSVLATNQLICKAFIPVLTNDTKFLILVKILENNFANNLEFSIELYKSFNNTFDFCCSYLKANSSYDLYFNEYDYNEQLVEKFKINEPEEVEVGFHDKSNVKKLLMTALVSDKILFYQFINNEFNNNLFLQLDRIYDYIEQFNCWVSYFIEKVDMMKKYFYIYNDIGCYFHHNTLFFYLPTLLVGAESPLNFLEQKEIICTLFEKCSFDDVDVLNFVYQKIRQSITKTKYLRTLLESFQISNKNVFEYLLSLPEIDINIFVGFDWASQIPYIIRGIKDDSKQQELIDIFAKRKNYDFNSPIDHYGNTILMHCVLYKLSLINYFFSNYQHEININQQNYDGDTVLTLAIKTRNVDLAIQLLTITLIDINIANNNGMSAICLAISFNDHSLVDILIEKGCSLITPKINKDTGINENQKNNDNTLLNESSNYSNNVGKFVVNPICCSKSRKMLEHLLDTSKPNDLNGLNEKGNTLLMEAILQKKLTAKDNNKNKNCCGTNKNSKKIMKVSAQRHKDQNSEMTVLNDFITPSFLLQKYINMIDINEKGANGKTALITAILCNDCDMIKNLMNNQALISENASDEISLLAASIKAHNDDLTRKLMNKCKFDFSALIEANIQNYNPSLFKIIQSKIMGNSKLIKLTEKQFASKVLKCNELFLKIIFSKPNTINVEKIINASYKGKTLLMRAIIKGNKYLLECLISKPNIDVNWRNAEGETALLLSIIYHRRDMTFSLLKTKNISIEYELRNYKVESPLIINTKNSNLVWNTKDIDFLLENKSIFLLLMRRYDFQNAEIALSINKHINTQYINNKVYSKYEAKINNEAKLNNNEIEKRSSLYAALLYDEKSLFNQIISFENVDLLECFKFCLHKKMDEYANMIIKTNRIPNIILGESIIFWAMFYKCDKLTKTIIQMKIPFDIQAVLEKSVCCDNFNGIEFLLKLTKVNKEIIEGLIKLSRRLNLHYGVDILMSYLPTK